MNPERKPERGYLTMDDRTARAVVWALTGYRLMRSEPLFSFRPAGPARG